MPLPRSHPKDFPSDGVLDQFFSRRFIQDGDRALLDQALELLPGVGVAIGGPIVEFVHTLRTGQVGKFNADRRVRMLLRIAPKTFKPCIVLAHLLRPYLHHGFRNGVRSAQGSEIGGGLLARRRIQVALACGPRVAAFLTFRRLLQDNHLGSQIVGRDSGRHAGCSESDDNDIGFHVPFLRQGAVHYAAAASTNRDAFSPIMMDGALVLPEVSVGMIDASATRNPSMPCTRSSLSTTAMGSKPILQVPTGW